MNSFLYIDLKKNIVTIEGQKYDVQREAKEGYEPYESSDGTLMYRKPVGQGGSEESSQKDGPDKEEGDAPKDEDGKTAEVDPSKDPLKQEAEPGTDSPEEAKVDLEGAKELKEEAPEALSPFSEPEDSSDPMDHYTAAALAEKLGDMEAANEHRERARQASEGLDAVGHEDLREKLTEAGLAEDAKFHGQQRIQRFNERFKEKLPEALEGTKDLGPRERARRLAEASRRVAERKKTKVDDSLKDGFASTQLAETPPEGPEDDIGTAATMLAEPEQRGASSQEESKKREEEQKEAQQKATEEFQKLSEEFDSKIAEAKKEQEDYKKKLGEYQQAVADYKADLGRAKDLLDEIKQQKPAKEARAVANVERRLDAHKKKLDEHKKNAPDGAKVKKTRRAKKDAQMEHKEAKRALKEHKRNAPIKKPNESDSSFEKRAKKHAVKTKKLEEKAVKSEKKLAAAEAQHHVAEKEHESAKEKHSKEGEKLKKKHQSLKAEHAKAKDAMNAAHEKRVAKVQKKYEDQKAKKESLPEKPEKPPASSSPEKLEQKKQQAEAKHKKKLESLKAEQAKADEKAKARQKAQAEKQKAQAEKQKEREEVEFSRKRAAAEKRDQKERENTPRPPENEMEAAAVQDHKSRAQEAYNNIQAHLDSGADIPEEQRSVLESMAEKIKAHSEQDTVPTSAEKKELQEALKLTRKHSSKPPKGAQESGGGESADKKSGKDRSGSMGARRMIQGAGSLGDRLGSAAANPYGGAGAFANIAADQITNGAASAGHYLLDSKTRKQSDASAQAEKNRNKSSSSGEATEKSLHLFLRARP